MKARHGALALFLSFACTDQAVPTESAKSALGVLPSTENATWKRVGATTLPDGRYAHALAFDETRQVVVMFGGMVTSSDGSMNPQQDTWEWNPSQSAWNSRTIAGAKPAARTGAAMAYDSVRSKFVLFGGRAGSGYDYQDTWEWDPATGVWTDKTGSGARPDARAQHGMIFDNKAGKIVLFGGGRSQIGGDLMTVSLAFDDTWEYDGATATWSKCATAVAPSARVDFGFAYSGKTNKGYLFGGMEVTSADMGGTPTQDSWEWDGAAATWTERTSTGDKPSPRFGHGMAVNNAGGQAVIFGGYDMATGGSLNDVWYWDVVAGTWTGNQPSDSASWPTQRQWSPLVFSTSTGRFYLVAGYVNDQGSYGGYGGTGGGYIGPVCLPGSKYCMSPSSGSTREVWELNPATTTWMDRSAPSNSPGQRSSHAMAADPVTGKVYVFGGQDIMGNILDDLWEWNGDKWVECSADIRPTARMDAALAYDPARKSLILFGGTSGNYTYYGTTEVLADTWEWNTGTRAWTQLFPKVSPSQRSGHGMVTESARKKIILYAGYDSSGSMGIYPPPYYYPDAGMYTDPNKSDVWEWDGASTTWTNRTTPTLSMPTGGSYPTMVFDEGRGKLTLLQPTGGYYGYGYGYSAGDYWEWDPASGAWSQKVTGEALGGGLNDAMVSYDSIRRRVVLLGMPMMTSTGYLSSFELDTSGPTWYARPPSGEPSDRQYASMAFDNQRGVVVLFGGMASGLATDETWEYSVTDRGNGTGCTAASAGQCASGNCVDGVCCESASCSGPCKSCNVPGKVGSCVLAAPGTQVAGSCSGDQACDASGACKAANGKGCSSAAACASGFCGDGVCCNSACTGTCVSCKLSGSVGVCNPFPVGTDPENECGKGTPPCQSTCDGIGACVFPMNSSCGTCGTCNGSGSCLESPYCTPPITATRTALRTTTGTSTGTLIPPITGLRTGTATGTSVVGTGTSTGTSSIATRTAVVTATSGTGTATTTSPTATVTTTGTRPAGTGSATGSRTASATDTGAVTNSATVTAVRTSTVSQTGIGTKPDAGLGTGDAGTGGSNGGSSGAGGTGGTSLKLGHAGCGCDLGSAPAGGPGLESLLGLLGALLIWRRTGKRQ